MLLQELIKILLLRYKVYLTYKLAKIRNSINKELLELKLEKLELISLDLVGLFLRLIYRNRELLRIVDNITQRV